MGELNKFWKNHPFLTVIFGVTGVYIATETYRAAKAEKGEFWGNKDGLFGIGSGPFARHQRMQSLPNPGQTAGTTSTSTTTSSSHSTGMMRGDEEHGEPSMPMPMQMHGVPSAIKRRVNHGEYGQDSLPDEYGISGVYVRPSPLGYSEAESIMGLDGILPASGGEGWL